MNEASRTLTQATLLDSDSGTSSAESPAGRSPSDSPDGPTIKKSLQGARRASHFPLLASAKEPPTNGISGRSFIESSERSSRGLFSVSKSAVQKSSDRLAAAMADELAKAPFGSMEFSLIWKLHTSPAQRLIFRLRASARRISDRDSFSSGTASWPTPNAQEFGCRDAERTKERREECKERTGNGNGFGLTLGQAAATLASWPTPNVPNGGRMGAPTQKRADGSKKQLSPEEAASLAGWPTPMAGTPAKDGNNEAGNNDSSRKTVEMAAWATPTAAKTTPQSRDNQCLARDVILQCGTEAEFEGLKEYLPSGWVTPSARDWKDSPGMATTGTNPDGSDRSRLDQLPRQAQLATWNTPRASDGTKGSRSAEGVEREIARKGRVDDLPSQVIGATSTSSPAETESSAASPGVLNPTFSCWLQGFPPEWIICGLRAMASRSRGRKSKVEPDSCADSATPSASQ